MNKRIENGHYADVGRKIKALREYLGLYRGEFGAGIGYSNSHIGMMENERIGVKDSTIEEICAVYHVDKQFFSTDDISDVSKFVRREGYDDLDVSGRLKVEREKRNYTQMELAEISGTSQSIISLVEKGQRTLTSKQAEKIASALRIGTEYLLTGNIEKRDNPVNHEMIDWLWKHPEERKKLWEKMEKNA